MTFNQQKTYIIGVISDTHGRLSHQLPDILKHADLIIHAGDVDDADTLESLKAIAPVIAVRGNMDRGAWAENLCETELVEIGGTGLYILHDIYNLDIDPESIHVKAVISGHTHRPSISTKGPVLYFNPGSATNPRGGNRPSVGILQITDEKLTGRIVEIPE